MTLWNRVRRVGQRRFQQLSTAGGVDLLRDRAVLARARRITRQAASEHLLIAPPGAGNIGDDAMVGAFLDNVPGPVRVVVRRDGDIRIPSVHRARVTVEAIPGLIYGGAAEHRVALARLLELLPSAASLSVVGADIMDGAYNLRASTRRADVAAVARAAGVDARVLGFSWNGHPDAGARRALSRAAEAGTSLLVRDPVSVERARSDGIGNVTGVADLVFAAKSSSAAVKERYLTGGAPGGYAVVNVSALIGRSIDQVSEYTVIIEALLDAGLSVVLLPHVVRASADDAAACRAVADEFDDARVQLVGEVIEPAEVRGLCDGATLVITGRMHLAIHGMWAGVPAIALSSQGKVEGLMQLFDVAELSVEPGPDLADRVVPLIAAVLARRSVYTDRIAERMPAVRALAELNFSALPGLSRGAGGRGAPRDTADESVDDSPPEERTTR